MLRTEDDIQAALLTLMPDPDTDADVINFVHRQIARRRTTFRATVIATSAAAVGVAASLVLAFAPSTTHSGQFKVTAPAEMRLLSKVAATQPQFKMPGPGQFYYTETMYYGGDCLKPDPGHGFTAAPAAGAANAKAAAPSPTPQPYSFEDHCAINVVSVFRTQEWVGHDGSGRILGTTVSSKFVSPSDRAHWIANGRRPKLNANNYDERDGKHQDSIGRSGLGKLPTDPAKLAKVIHDHQWEHAAAGPGGDFTQVGDLLRFPNASTKLRVAAFEVGARIPGVKSLGTVTFHGVSGVAIGLTAKLGGPFYKGAHETWELVFDRATSTLKAEVYRIVKDGKVIDSGGTAYVAAGLVNSTHSTLGH
jgi:hypothetical protein